MLLVFWFFKILVDVVLFLFADIVFDIAQVFTFILVFFCNLGDVDTSNWMTLMAFLLAFVFLGGWSLGLGLTCISRRGTVRHSLIFILINFVNIFFGWFVALWIFKIDFSYFWGWLETCFCLCIDSLFYYFFSQIQVTSLVI